MGLRAALIVAGWVAGWWLLWIVPRLRTAGPHAPEGPNGPADALPTSAVAAAASRCSVIIPARNEAASIGALLASLAAQTVTPLEILVVDDQSDDGTAAIVTGHRGVRLVTGEPVPAGWTGKTWACHQGAHLASGSILVFLDADVSLAPGALASLLAEHEQRRGLVSVQPFHRMERAYERFSALFNVVGMMGVGTASPRPAQPAHGAFGPCLATDRSDYDAAGGHRAVRGEIVEDLALAKRYADADLPVAALGGRDLVSFRMYPEGLGQLIEGWSKNMASGASTVVLGRLFLIGYWITSILLVVQSTIEVALGRIDDPLLVAGVYLLVVLQLAVMLRQLGNFGVVTALLFPAPAGIFVVVFARSAYLTLVRRRVTWRGRPIALSDAADEGVDQCR